MSQGNTLKVFSNLTHKYLNFNNFSKLLLKWSEFKNSRQMPWKGEKDPYKIWISEIILQQTRVEQGLEYYNRFITSFPTIRKLACANEKNIFKHWEGLGYYSRCRNLIATAKYIHIEKNDVFPDTYEDILKLKGIGPYTAAAIASFAYNLPYAVVDGNVFRVLARVFGISVAIDSPQGKKLFTSLANKLLDQKTPGIYNQAIMDFGATVCKPVNPLCSDCLFNKNCEAHLQKKTTLLPVKAKKVKQQHRYFYFFIIRHGNKTAIRERTEQDIWRHLHEFPLIELSGDDQVTEAIAGAKALGWFSNCDTVLPVKERYKQKLTHQTITARFLKVKVPTIPPSLTGYSWIDPDALRNYSFPKIINDLLPYL
ncbi:MAG: A/G-specific adenine glycosylase [Niabella sp.]